MKKLHFLFSLLFLSLIGTASVQAQWSASVDPLLEVTPGQRVVLQMTTSNSNGGYLCGDGTSTTITDDCIYTFEEAGAIDGYVTYYLKQESTGLYLKNDVLENGQDSSDKKAAETGSGYVAPYVWYTSDTSEAFEFTACYTGSTGDYRSAIAAGLSYQGFILCGTRVYSYTSTEEDGTTQLHENVATYLGCVGTDPFLSPWDDTNCWILRELVAMDGYEILSNYLTTLETELQGAAYEAGTAPGQVTADARAAIDDEIAAANLLVETDPSVEEAQAEVEKLKALKEALDASRIPLAEGYFFIKDSRGTPGAVFDNIDRLGFTPGYTLPTTGEGADAKYIWKLTDTGNGTYTLQNYYTGYYATYETISYQNDNCFVSGPSADAWAIVYQAGQPGSFNIYKPDAASVAWNTQNKTNGGICSWNDLTDVGNCFRFYSVDQEIIDYLATTVDQERLNAQLQQIYDKAQAAYVESRKFVSEAPADVTPATYADNKGLLLDPSQVSSNAPYTGSGADGAGTPALIDGDMDTYFHTDYSDAAPTDEDHNLYFDLGASHSTFTIQYVVRAAGYATQATPSVVVFQGADSKEGPWADVTSDVTLPYQYTAKWVEDESTQPTANAAGAYTLDLPKAYQHYRMVVKEVKSGAASHMKNGHYFWYLSEFHVYPANYDPASPFEMVSEATRTEFTDQLEIALEQLSEGVAEEGTIEALQAAYDAFVAECPVPARLTDALAEAKTWAAGAEEGTLPGFYEDGSLATFNAAVAAVEAKLDQPLTVAAIDEGIAELNAAVAEFGKHLILPEAGKMYTITGMSTDEVSKALNSLLYAESSALSAVKWGGYDYDNSLLTVEAAEQLEYVWFCENVEADGSFALRNLGTGLYMGNQGENNGAVNLSVEPCTLKLRSARVAGGFNIVVGEGEYANMQGSSYKVVAWSSAQGADNSALRFNEIEINENNTTKRAITLGQAQVICLPYSIYAFADAAKFYSVLGKNNGKLILKEETTVIPAATPFIYIPNESMTAETESFYVNFGSEGYPAYVQEPATVNGLAGTLTGATIGQGCGVFSATGITLTTGNRTMAANSGWLNHLLPETTEAGDLQLDLPGEITAIEAVAVETAAPVNVYTLSGVRVRTGVSASVATQNLPAGIYIVGGKKVIVK